MATYDSLHKQCRTLESLFDTKLTSYSRLASTISRSQDDVESGGSMERWKDLELEVDDLLEKARELLRGLLCNWLLNFVLPARGDKRAISLTCKRPRFPTVPINESRYPKTPRCLPGLCARTKADQGDFPPVFREGVLTICLQTNVQHALDQANLLSGVRNDIEYNWPTYAPNAVTDRSMTAHINLLQRIHYWQNVAGSIVRIE
jgi:Golgi SNAP receptor complex protein 1